MGRDCVKPIRKLALWAIALTTSTLLSACCGNGEAKKIVKSFLDSNLKSTEYNAEYFSRVDSTFVVSDSALNAMQRDANQLGMFKPIAFANRGKGKKLNYIRARYTIGSDTIKQVFYIDSEMRHVVGVKSDI